MFRFTLFLFTLCCLLTGYRLVEQSLPAESTLQLSVSAQSSALVDADATAQAAMQGTTPAPTVAPLFRTQAIGTAQPNADGDPTTSNTTGEQSARGGSNATTPDLSRDHDL